MNIEFREVPMRTTFKLILLLISLLFCSFVDSSEYDWQKVRDQSGIQIYIKKYLNNDIKSFKGIITIDTSVDSILAVIMDFDACSDWIHHCKKSTLLLRIIFFRMFSPPEPDFSISNTEYTFYFTFKSNTFP